MKYRFTTEDWMSIYTPLFQQYLNKYKDEKVDFLEIGSFEGRSSLWLIENILTHSQSTITCIDAWGFDTDIVYSNFLYNVSITGCANKVYIYRLLSIDALKLLYLRQYKYNFIYVDANHVNFNPLKDGILAFPLLQIGGIMAFDDYAWGDNIKRSIDMFLDIYANYITILYRDKQVWIQKNIDGDLIFK